MLMDRLADFRRVFAQAVVARAGCPGNTSLLEAFAAVPRHEFVGPGPWVVTEDGATTPSDDPAIVYQDMGIGIAHATPTGLPSIHACFLDACELERGSSVAHIGAGTGYFSAILAELVGDAGRVMAFEINDELAVKARHNLRPWPWVELEARSGVTLSSDPVDLVYVNAGVQQLPRPWLEALRPGGRLLFPLVPGTKEGAVFVVTSLGARAYATRLVCSARFVPCVGAEDEAASVRLAEAFRTDGGQSVRSLRVSPESPDDSVWFAGAGWWLSKRDP